MTHMRDGDGSGCTIPCSPICSRHSAALCSVLFHTILLAIFNLGATYDYLSLGGHRTSQSATPSTTVDVTPEGSDILLVS